MKNFPYFFLLFFCIFSVQPVIAFSPLKIIHDVWAGLHWPYSSDTSIAPANFDFWHYMEDLGDKANAYKEKLLKDVPLELAQQFQETMNQVVTGAEAMGAMLQHVDFEDFQKQFLVELSRDLEALKEEFSEPLPEDQTERYQQQALRFSRALDLSEEALVNVCGFWKVPEADVRKSFGDIKPHINHGLLIIANLVNNHPVLFETILLSAIIMIMPQRLILQPIFNLLGFGPSGVVKGSFAASAQRFFFGAVVKKGSWFAILQRAGMITLEAGWVTMFIRVIKCFFWLGC